jgi:cell growth-regulating nucleolar protein
MHMSVHAPKRIQSNTPNQAKMVFFVCETCNETLKKNQVDKHCYSCRGCNAVTCVDCSVTFYGNDYAAHTTCISEAEKYEKSLFKPKSQTKPKAQDLWTELIEEIVSMSSSAPSPVKPYLQRLSQLGNVPRNKKKFLNFAKNSLNLYKDNVLEEIWNFLDVCRLEKESQYKTDEVEPTTVEVETPKSLEPIVEEKKKDKKRKLEEVEVVAVEEEKKVKKHKKKSKDHENNAEEKKVDESVVEVEVKKSKKEKKEKKEKKSKQ